MRNAILCLHTCALLKGTSGTLICAMINPPSSLFSHVFAPLFFFVLFLSCDCPASPSLLISPHPVSPPPLFLHSFHFCYMFVFLHSVVSLLINITLYFTCMFSSLHQLLRSLFEGDNHENIAGLPIAPNILLREDRPACHLEGKCKAKDSDNGPKCCNYIEE